MPGMLWPWPWPIIWSIIATWSGISIPYQSFAQERIWAISLVWSSMIACARSLVSWCGACAATGRAIMTAMAWCIVICERNALSKSSPVSWSRGGVWPIWAAVRTVSQGASATSRASVATATGSNHRLRMIDVLSR